LGVLNPSLRRIEVYGSREINSIRLLRVTFAVGKQGVPEKGKNRAVDHQEFRKLFLEAFVRRKKEQMHCSSGK